MILDKDLRMSDAQAIVDTGVSTNYIDLGSAYSGAIAKYSAYSDKEMHVMVRVNTAYARGAGASTLIVAVQHDNDPAFGTVASIHTSPSYATGALTAGAELVKIKLPPGLKRYLRISYTFGAAHDAGGKMDAFLVTDIENRF